MENQHIEFKTESEYLQAKAMYDAYEAVRSAWMHENQSIAVPCAIAETFPFAKELGNALYSAIETWEFVHDIPDQYFVYINDVHRKATTWTGQILGNVSFGSEYTSNFRDKRVPVTVYAINGKRYYGIYYKSAGDYARIRLSKKQVSASSM